VKIAILFSTSVRDNNLPNSILNTATVTISLIISRKLHIIDLLWIYWLWALLSQRLHQLGFLVISAQTAVSSQWHIHKFKKGAIHLFLISLASLSSSLLPSSSSPSRTP